MCYRSSAPDAHSSYGDVFVANGTAAQYMRYSGDEIKDVVADTFFLLVTGNSWARNPRLLPPFNDLILACPTRTHSTVWISYMHRQSRVTVHLQNCAKFPQEKKKPPFFIVRTLIFTIETCTIKFWLTLFVFSVENVKKTTQLWLPLPCLLGSQCTIFHVHEWRAYARQCMYDRCTVL